MSADVETVVVGAGVVGVAVARALAEAGHEVMVLEQHALIGSETSSRNSEVIHAGIYYRRAACGPLCAARETAAVHLLRENDVGHARSGKLVVATHEIQPPKLAAIRQTAEKNGVSDLEPLGGNAARALEPELACVAALLSPSTGIVDSHGFMLALEGISRRAAAGGAEVPGGADRAHGAGLYRLVTGGAAPGPSPAAASVVSARAVCPGCPHAELWRGLQPARDLLRQGPVLRALRPLAVPAPHLSDAGRRLAGLHATVDIGGRCKLRSGHRVDRKIDYGFDPANAGEVLTVPSASTTPA